MIPRMIVRAIEHWPVDRLVRDRRNSRSHPAKQIERLAAIIQKFGFVNPILVGRDKVIIAGHGRLEAARQLGLEQVPVIVIDHLSDAERRALALADNRLAEDALWDEDLLRAELAALRDEALDLELTGFDKNELKRLLAGEGGDDSLTGEKDSIPDPPTIPTSMPGDLWRMGEGRVGCGDATKSVDVLRLMAEDRGDLGFADPFPKLGPEDAKEDCGFADDAARMRFQGFLTASLKHLRLALKLEASLYVCYPWQRQHVFQESLTQALFIIRSQIIWAKGAASECPARYRPQHETVLYAHVIGHEGRWFSRRQQTTVWQADGIEPANEQPGVRPVEQVERAIKNSSQAGDVVVDLFGGTGTTLIACERTRRKARVMEIEPAYVDLTILRWQGQTGKDAILEGDGRSFNEITKTGRRRNSSANEALRSRTNFTARPAQNLVERP